jgi:isochorismate synthase
MTEKEKATFISSTLSSLDKKELLHRLLGKSISDNFSIAIWRMPNQNSSQLFIDFKQNREFEIEELEDLPAGFVFAPFLENDKKIYIQGELQIAFSDSSIKLNSLALTEDNLTWLEEALQYKSDIRIKNKFNSKSTSKSKYKSWVNEGVSRIMNGEFKKVVPARILVKEWRGNPIEIFNDLSSRYPNAFVSITCTPQAGCWIGATPELLLSVDKNKIFRTASLAGTKAFDQSVMLHNVTWTQKEIEEQAMVSRYIINCFKTIRLREFDEEGPMTIKAGNLVHLKTNFIVDMKSTNFPNLGSTMLRLLHPTSAVCGMPKDAAADFLEKIENFDRTYFSGYLGPINVEDETNIFVNIRCARLIENHSIIFAGAGVTSYSNAESEWEETELKCKTLLDVMS